MEIPFSLLLYIYIGLLGIFALLSFFDLYHIIRFGFLTPTSVFVTFIFIAGAAIILFASYQQLRLIDWAETITINLPAALS